VDVRISATDLGGGTYEVTVVATPLGDVDFLDVKWLPRAHASVKGAQRVAFGVTPAWHVRTARARVQVDGPGAKFHVSVAVGVAPGVRPAKLVEVVLGSPPLPPPQTSRLVTLPSGEVIEEVRP
jgi:hypothetical protein